MIISQWNEDENSLDAGTYIGNIPIKGRKSSKTSI
jgi:hypothetical protein